MKEELPDNWTKVNLENVVEIYDNRRKPISAKERSKRLGDIPYYGATGIAGYIDDYIFDEELVLLGEDGAPFLERNKNVAYLIKGKSWVNNHAHVLKGRDGIVSNKIVLYFLNQFNYNGYVGGTTRLKLNQKNLKIIPFPLSPLAEQERIVAKLDNLFTKLDKIKASLAKIPELLQNFRQQVLTQAVTGKLTEEWRKGSSKWNKATIKELSQKIFDGPFGSKLKTADYTPSGVQVVRLENIKRLSFDTTKQSFISKEKYEELKGNTLKKGDIIFASFVGDEIRATLLPELSTPAINKADCFCIRLDQEKIDKHFCLYVLLSNEGKDQIIELAHGITRPRINLTQLRSINIPLPSLKEQQEIVNRVENLFNKADKIQKKYEVLKTNIEQLPRAILHKAFKGELVPQLESDGDAKDLLREIEGLKAESLLKKASGRRKAIKDFGKDYTLEQERQLKVAEEKETYKK
ncbi:type I restriction enzyme, S subunit [Salegentibacter holothuriorum]|uniref:Type I restriction enzyme, S subunit n=1 Tax=Salegentibacter holothuriorum TaxID=241145 RepID=A0A1T5AXK9_9FLAO|nr:restriction endonuclease subunit S [Salegentibacter holothuriorum]SKB39373.1 type I restriction enzyme, S subunit [Salegentibacter holothuriorum]